MDSILVMHRKRSMLFDLFFGLFGIAVVSAVSAELPASRHAFIVIAHRGNHTRAHENTLKALQEAIDAGADYAEIDVRQTADGAYVLMHDGTVDRMTDGHGAVKDLTLKELRALHVRDSKRPQIPADRIPTFTEALQQAKGRLNIYLDFKEGERAQVAGLIRNMGLVGQILVYDGVESVSEWHRVAPELPLIISPPENARTQVLAFAETNHIEVLDGSWNEYTPEVVATSLQSTVRIWPDIQAAREDAAYFEKVLGVGFTGVQTDHPEELIHWLEEHHRR